MGLEYKIDTPQILTEFLIVLFVKIRRLEVIIIVLKITVISVAPYFHRKG